MDTFENAFDIDTNLSCCEGVKIHVLTTFTYFVGKIYSAIDG